MVGKLLLRGMLVGVIAGLLAFGFARIFGEPQVERAIAFEAQMSHVHGEASEPELVGREMQAGLGLFVGVIVYSAAIGGLFRSSSPSSTVVRATWGPVPLQHSWRWPVSLRSCSSPGSNILQTRLRSEILRRSGFERSYSL